MIHAKISEEDLSGIKNVVAKFTKNIDLNECNGILIARAVTIGNDEIVDFLLSCGVDVTKNSNYAIYIAARQGELDTVQKLIAHGASFDNPDFSLDQFVIYLRKKDFGEVGLFSYISKLVDLGFDVSARDNSAIAYACEQRDLDYVELYLAQGASATSNDNLPIQSLLGTNEFSKYIKRFKNDWFPTFLDHESVWKRIPLSNTAKKILEILLSHGADIAANNNQCIVIANALYTHKDVELILSLGSGDTLKNNVALDVHCYDADRDIVRQLLTLTEYGSNEVHRALINACINGDVDIVMMLLKHGANCSFLQHSSLKVASENGHVEVIKLFISQGLQLPKTADRSLDAACKNGHIEVVKLFAENNVRMDRKNTLVQAYHAYIQSLRDSEHRAFCVYQNEYAELPSFNKSRKQLNKAIGEIEAKRDAYHGDVELINLLLSLGSHSGLKTILFKAFDDSYFHLVHFLLRKGMIEKTPLNDIAYKLFSLQVNEKSGCSDKALEPTNQAVNKNFQQGIFIQMYLTALEVGGKLSKSKANESILSYLMENNSTELLGLLLMYNVETTKWFKENKLDPYINNYLGRTLRY
tara:strand:+ start:2101 stop:3852 length:1752 start_codon:yes stop_codon:yes gene_type:complete